MSYPISLKTRYITMTSVAALMAIGLSSTSVQAACMTTGVGTVTINCSTGMTSTTGVTEAAATDVTTVNVQATTTVDDSGMAKPAAIVLGGSDGDSVNVVASDSVVSGSSKGILIVDGDNHVVNNKGQITGGAIGIDMNGGAGGESGYVVNNQSTGVITGSTDIGVNMGAISSGGINNSGDISGFNAGVAINTSTATFFANVTVTNDASGTISSSNGVGIKIVSAGGDSINVINRGEITGGNGIAISGTNGDEKVENDGEIRGDVNLGIGDNKVFNGEIGGVPQGFGHIHGDVITGNGNDELRNSTGATIFGNVNLGDGTNTINNKGTIGNGAGSGNVTTGNGKDTITNSGLITGTVNLGSGQNTLNNSGTVSGGYIGGANADTINNTGVINGGAVLGNGTNQINNNFGIITGGVTGGNGSDTITNTVGLMVGNINMGDGTNTLNNAGGIILGQIQGGNGNDTVNNFGLMIGNMNLGNGSNIYRDLANSTLVGNLTTGIGTDIVDIQGTITGNVSLGLGNDTLTLHDTTTLGAGTVINGGLLGNDALILTGGVGTKVLTNDINNFETLTLNNANQTLWALDRNYTFTNSTTITRGGLEVRAGRTLTSANVAVGANGLLTGDGRVVGNVTVNGTIRPGNGTTGTLTIQGNYNNGATGVLEVGVGPGMTQSKLMVTGTAALGNQGTLKVEVAPGLFKKTTTYNVVEAGNVTGTYGTTVFSKPGNLFTKFTTKYIPKAVQVIITKLSYGDVVGDTYNRHQTGDALFRGMQASATGSDMEKVADQFEGLPVGSHGYALDSLSGDVYPAMEALQEQVAKNFRNVAGNRTNQFLEGANVWGNVIGTNQTIRSDGNGDRSKGDIQGAVGGIEYGFGNAKIGLFGGYGQGHTDLSQHLSSGKNDQIVGGAYAGVNYHGFVVSGQFSYGQGHNDVKRHIAVGSIQRDVSSKEKVRLLGGNASVGYDINLGVITLTPGLGVDVTQTQSNGFEEKGNGGDVALQGKRHRDLLVSGEAGLRVSANWNLGLVSIAPYVSGQFSRQVAGDSYRDRDLSFQGNPTGTGFNVRSANAGKNRFLVGGGLAIGVGMVKLELGYSQDINVGGDKQNSRNFTAGLGFHW